MSNPHDSRTISLEPGECAIILGDDGVHLTRRLETTPELDAAVEAMGDDEGIPLHHAVAIAFLTRLDDDPRFMRTLLKWLDVHSGGRVPIADRQDTMFRLRRRQAALTIDVHEDGMMTSNVTMSQEAQACLMDGKPLPMSVSIVMALLERVSGDKTFVDDLLRWEPVQTG